MKNEDDHDDQDHNKTTSYSDNVQMDDCKCWQLIWKYGPYSYHSHPVLLKELRGELLLKLHLLPRWLTQWLSLSVIRAMPWLWCSRKTPSLRKRSAKSWFYNQISEILILINQISKVLSAAEAQAKQAEQQAALMQVLTFFRWKWCWFEVDEKTRKNKLKWFSL